MPAPLRPPALLWVKANQMAWVAVPPRLRGDPRPKPTRTKEPGRPKNHPMHQVSLNPYASTGPPEPGRGAAVRAIVSAGPGAKPQRAKDPARP